MLPLPRGAWPILLRQKNGADGLLYEVRQPEDCEP
jgi:hypothetical protein